VRAHERAGIPRDGARGPRRAAPPLPRGPPNAPTGACGRRRTQPAGPHRAVICGPDVAATRRATRWPEARAAALVRRRRMPVEHERSTRSAGSCRGGPRRHANGRGRRRAKTGGRPHPITLPRRCSWRALLNAGSAQRAAARAVEAGTVARGALASRPTRVLRMERLRRRHQVGRRRLASSDGDQVVTFGWSGAWAELRAVDTAARAMVPGFVDLGAVSALPSPAFGKLVLDVRPPVAYGSKRLTSTARDGWVGRLATAPLGSPLMLASDRSRCPTSRPSGLGSTAWRLTGGPPPSGGAFPLEPNVQPHLGAALLTLVELAAGGERVGLCGWAGDRRGIERACVEDVAYRVIAAANQVPNHCTIARFRQRHQDAHCEFHTSSLDHGSSAGCISCCSSCSPECRVGSV
jgi:hypothetical protein